MGKGMRAGKKNKPLSQRTGKSMSGGNGNQAAQMAQLQAMQAQMDEAQALIAEKEVTTTAGGGAVECTINGKKQLVSINIDEDVLNPDEKEMLQDLIIVAVNEAIRQIDEIAEQEMGKVTSGLGLPPGLI